MSSLRAKTILIDDANPSRAEGPPELAHYLRQATITLRRRSPSLDHVWRKHRQESNRTIAWKH